MFPLDSIKIDRSFVKDLLTNADCVAIVRRLPVWGVAYTSIRSLREYTEDQLMLMRASGRTRAEGLL